jgi:hypothetical protein
MSSSERSQSVGAKLASGRSRRRGWLVNSEHGELGRLEPTACQLVILSGGVDDDRPLFAMQITGGTFKSARGGPPGCRGPEPRSVIVISTLAAANLMAQVCRNVWVVTFQVALLPLSSGGKASRRLRPRSVHDGSVASVGGPHRRVLYPRRCYDHAR